jgi:predicted RNA-binding protein with TRAM domain
MDVVGIEQVGLEQVELIAVAVGAAVLLLALVVLWRRRSAGRRKSKHAHESAQERAPPVELGETYEFGVTEFADHHSGKRVAVGKVEGFVVFAEDVPGRVSEGDVIRARVLSFNRGKTSADASFVGSA